MYRKLCTIFLAVIVALSPLCAQAQQDKSAAQSKQAEDHQALQQKSFELLESLAGELGTLQSPENRARLGSNIAWSLWPHNENRARELFTQVQADINLGLQAPESAAPEDIKTFMVFLKLRADTIERIAKHDSEFAYEFFNATALSHDRKLPYSVQENDKALESHIAKQVSSSNPNLTLEIARKMLAQGFSDDLRILISRLNRKHKAQATVLYKEIVRKLGDADIVDDWSARNLALNLAGYFAPPTGDAATYREIVNMFIKAMAQNACASKLDNEDERAEICRELGPSIPLIAKVDPSGASKLQRWAEGSEYYQSLPSPYYELNELAQDGSIDEMLALIERYPQMEFDVRFRAAQKAQRAGNPERARKILEEYTSDPERQRALLMQLDQIQARATMTREQLDEVQKQVSERPSPLAKVVLLSNVANHVGDDHKTSLKLLNQAAEIMETMKPGKEQARAQILLAIMYSHEKDNRGLAMMEALIPKLNELVASASKLDGYDTSYLRDGEWNMTAEGELGTLLTWLAQNAGYFAWCDFDRAVGVAGQFERPEIRMMAQLKLAQGVLAGPPKRLQLGYEGSQY